MGRKREEQGRRKYLQDFDSILLIEFFISPSKRRSKQSLQKVIFWKYDLLFMVTHISESVGQKLHIRTINLKGIDMSLMTTYVWILKVSLHMS